MNPVVHFEMPYTDGKRVKKFYEAVFGWKTEQLGAEMGDYILVVTAERDVKAEAPRGAINGGLFPYKPEWPDQYPSVVIGVKNIKETMKKVTDNGGEVLGDPMEIPGTGLYASFRDTEGNRNSILQPMEM